MQSSLEQYRVIQISAKYSVQRNAEERRVVPSSAMKDEVVQSSME